MHSVQSNCAGTLLFPRWRPSDLTKPNEQERITAGWIISGVENQLCSIPQLYKSHLDRGCWKEIGPRLPVTLAIELTRGPSPPAMRLRDFSDSCRGLKGDDISHIISWGHQGCMAVWALLVWFITLSVISFSDGWLIGQAWNSFLSSIDNCVCAQYIIGGFWVYHYNTHLL